MLDELTRAMRDGERSFEPPVPDLTALRARGRSARRSRRLVVAGVAVATAAAVVTGVVLATGAGLHRADPPRPAKPPEEVVTAFEHRVLGQVPGARLVQGQVVVPGSIDPAAEDAWRLRTAAGRVAPLGWHGYVDFRDRPVASTRHYPSLLRRPVPGDAQIYADEGPMRLACHPTTGAACNLLLVVGDPQTGWFSIMHDPAWLHLGDRQFLRGRGMEVFPSDTFSGAGVRPVLIGGFRGTAATRVELTLRDGRTAAARVDSGRVVPGSTLFWALTPVPATRVTAYDDSGTVVADHRLSACYSPVDCQIR